MHVEARNKLRTSSACLAAGNVATMPSAPAFPPSSQPMSIQPLEGDMLGDVDDALVVATVEVSRDDAARTDWSHSLTQRE